MLACYFYGICSLTSRRYPSEDLEALLLNLPTSASGTQGMFYKDTDQNLRLSLRF